MSTKVRLTFLGYSKYRISDKGILQRQKSNGTWKTLKTKNSGKYHKAILCQNGIKKQFLVHKLVLLAFKGPPPSKKKKHGRHLNGKSWDNRSKNLKWGTVKKNSEDRVKHGTQVRGATHGRSKLTIEIVIKMRKYFSKKRKYGSKAKMARKYKVSLVTFCRAIDGETWKWVL